MWAMMGMMASSADLVAPAASAACAMRWDRAAALVARACLVNGRGGGDGKTLVVTRAYDTNVAEYDTPLLVSHHPACCWPRAPAAVVGRLWGGGTWGGRVTFAFPPPSLGA